METRFRHRGRWLALALLSSWMLSGCRDQCPEGQIIDVTTGICGPTDTTPPPPPPDCSAVPKPPCTAELQPQFFGTAQICVPSACEAGCELRLGICQPPVEECPPGFVREGELCLIDETASCCDFPNLASCIQPFCTECP